jgi:hypothetical protein
VAEKQKSKTDMTTTAEPQSNMPDQLKRQIAEAEKLREQMAVPEPAAAPPVEQPGAPQAPPQGAQPEAAGAAGQPEESWEQRFKSLQGRLDAMLESNRQLAEHNSSLENQISSMLAAGAQQPPEGQPATRKDYPKLVTDDELKDYGEDFFTVVGKKAREEYAPEFDELAARLARLEGRVEGVTQITARTQVKDVYQTLDSDVQNWRDINTSEAFKNWLQFADPFSGKRRHDLLMDAFSRHDAKRVVNFFNGFLAEATGTPPNSESPGSAAPPLAPSGTPGVGNGSGRPSLEDFAAPGRARSSPEGHLPPDKPVYTSAWIAKFMADKRTGKYRGREADADAIERDIYQAQHEGRIQN